MKINLKNKNFAGLYKNYVLLGICAVLAAINVVMTIDGAASGLEISDLRKKEAILIDQKRNLQSEFVQTLSTENIEEKGLTLGFVKPQNTVYLSQELPVAKLP